MKVRRVDLYPDEWIAGTQGMTVEEEGIYTRIVIRMYSHGGELPADPSELARLCNVRPQMMRRLLPKLLPKFLQTGRKLRQNRVQTEIKVAENRIETARLNGVKSKKTSHLADPGGGFSVKAKYTTLEEKTGFLPNGINPGLFFAPGGSPPLPSQGDGGAPPGATATREEGAPYYDDPAREADRLKARDEILRKLREEEPSGGVH